MKRFETRLFADKVDAERYRKAKALKLIATSNAIAFTDEELDAAIDAVDLPTLPEEDHGAAIRKELADVKV